MARSIGTQDRIDRAAGRLDPEKSYATAASPWRMVCRTSKPSNCG
jgi:hypothetical protein